MRAGDVSAFHQMARMYTLENAIAKSEFKKKMQESQETETKQEDKKY
jgi:hypothetical protein